MLKVVHACVKESASLYVEAQISGDPDICRAYDYVRKNKKCLSIRTHTDAPMFVNEERVVFNGLILLAEEEVDKVILAHYGVLFGCGTRALHGHLSKINNYTLIVLLALLFLIQIKYTIKYQRHELLK